jgi:hypothetical protein
VIDVLVKIDGAVIRPPLLSLAPDAGGIFGRSRPRMDNGQTSTSCQEDGTKSARVHKLS